MVAEALRKRFEKLPFARVEQPQRQKSNRTKHQPTLPRRIDTPLFIQPYLTARHHPMRLPVVGRIVQSYYAQRDRDEPAQVKPHYQYLPQAQRFPKTRAYVFPGFLGYLPSETFLDQLAPMFEYGMAFISPSEEAALYKYGSHLLIGGPSPSVTPDWEHIVPTALLRMYADIRLQEHIYNDSDRGNLQKIVLVGHSMGGLLIHTLKAIAKLYHEGKYDRLFKKYPHLAPQHFDQHILDKVLALIYEADLVTIGTPFKGIDNRTLAAAKASGFGILFHGSEDRFHPIHLDRHYDEIDLEPDDPTHGVDAFIYSTLGEDSQPRDLSLANPFLGITDRVFQFGGAVLAGGDGLVEPPPVHLTNTIHIPGENHLTIVESTDSGSLIRERLPVILRP